MKKALVIRMSSLGDVILSTAFLENLEVGQKVDWVISSDFAFVLKGHPAIERLIVFDKRDGLKGWIRLIRELANTDYAFRADLHVTIRSGIARLVFFAGDLARSRFIEWRSISKQRFRFFGHLIFKGFWPSRFQPIPFWKRFASLAYDWRESNESKVLLPPSFTPLLESRQQEILRHLQRYGLEMKRYYAVMPSSRWRSKEWPVEKYAKLCSTLQSDTGAPILLVGRAHDPACQELIPMLLERKVNFVSALDEPDFLVTAFLLQQAIAYIGGDTGLFHLSEAVGTPSVVIFGPTRPSLGFGPWRKDSPPVYSDAKCSPCSKDGRICYRFYGRFDCLKRIEVERVRKAIPT